MKADPVRVCRSDRLRFSLSAKLANVHSILLHGATQTRQSRSFSGDNSELAPSEPGPNRIRRIAPIRDGEPKASHDGTRRAVNVWNRLRLRRLIHLVRHWAAEWSVSVWNAQARFRNEQEMSLARPDSLLDICAG